MRLLSKIESMYTAGVKAKEIIFLVEEATRNSKTIAEIDKIVVDLDQLACRAVIDDHVEAARLFRSLRDITIDISDRSNLVHKTKLGAIQEAEEFTIASNELKKLSKFRDLMIDLFKVDASFDNIPYFKAVGKLSEVIGNHYATSPAIFFNKFRDISKELLLILQEDWPKLSNTLKKEFRADVVRSGTKEGSLNSKAVALAFNKLSPHLQRFIATETEMQQIKKYSTG